MFILNLLTHSHLEATQQPHAFNTLQLAPTPLRLLKVAAITTIMLTTLTMAETSSEKSTDQTLLAKHIENMNPVEFLGWLNENGAHISYTTGLSLNAQPSQPTALSMALQQGNTEQVKRLINAENLETAISLTIGKRVVKATPLGLAAYYGHKDVVAFLLAQGAEFDPQPSAMLVIELAIRAGDIDMMNFLFEKGASRDFFMLSDLRGIALDHAALKNDKETEYRKIFEQLKEMMEAS